MLGRTGPAFRQDRYEPASATRLSQVSVSTDAAAYLSRHADALQFRVQQPNVQCRCSYIKDNLGFLLNYYFQTVSTTYHFYGHAYQSRDQRQLPTAYRSTTSRRPSAAAAGCRCSSDASVATFLFLVVCHILAPATRKGRTRGPGGRCLWAQEGHVRGPARLQL